MPRTDPSVQALQQNAVENSARYGVAVIAAAGATQGNATQIPLTAKRILATCTLSSQGLKLPAAATGDVYTIFAQSARGVKVYPFTGDRIHGAATNAALALPLNRSFMFIAADSINWRVLKGA